MRVKWACLHNLYPDRFSVSVFERANDIGGTWLYTDRTDLDEYGLPVHSSIPKALRTNLPKEMMYFPDFPFDEEDSPSFLGHADVLAYLKRYAEQFDLYRHVSLHTLVETVTPKYGAEDGLLEKSRWDVRTRDLVTGRITVGTFDSVLVCAGHYSKPYMQSIPGLDDFPGRLTHSHTFRTREKYAGKRVLVVGSGSSGNDILGYLAPVAKSIYIVYRSEKVRFKLMPNIEQFPPVTGVAPDGTVSFENGESRVLDDIILCTGYEYNFPFLTRGCGIQVESGRHMKPLYKHTFNINHPSMAFLGINYSIVAFPFYHIQSQLVVSVLLGKTKLPEEKVMDKECSEEYITQLEQGFPPHHAHKVEPGFPLAKEFAEMAGIEPLPLIFEKMDEEVLEYRAVDLWNFRKFDYKVIKTEDGEVTFTKHLRKGEVLV